MTQPAKTLENTMLSYDEICHKITQLSFREGDRKAEILQLVDALQKIGYFESFQVTNNEQFSSVLDTKTPERRRKTRRKAAYRHIKKYYKSTKQYKKERLRRKLCWLLSGKYRETEIAKMLGISRRTVIRDMNKIKPYYFRLSRSYFRELERQKILDFKAKLDSAKTLKQRFDILTAEMEVLRKRMKQREYNRHVIKVFIDLDFMKYDGFPRITIWPKGSCEISRPHIFKFYCQKDGQKHEMYPPLVISEVEKRSWW